MDKQEVFPVAQKPVSHSVLFFKRLIAATLALIILTLAGLCVYFGLRLRRAHADLNESQSRLLALAEQEAERLAAEEAEQMQNAVVPEQEKPAGEATALEILDANRLVSHALGTADGIQGINCLEGFLENYAEGVRVFEVDLRMTADGHVVLRHDWNGNLQEGVDETALPTLEEFLAKPFYGMYTPMSFRDLLLLMQKYPDICVVTDTKFMDAEPVTAQFRAMLDDAHELGLSYLFDRIIVQVYSPLHFSIVDNIHHFPYYIYTLYQDSFDRSEEGFRQKAIFCQEHGIIGLTLNEVLWDPDYAPIASWRNVRVCLHTVNDASDARQLLDSGVNAIYTDILIPADLEG